MIETEFVAVAVVYTLGMLAPGPNFFLILSNAMSQGRQAGILTAFGVVVGTLFWILLSLSSVGLLIERSPHLFMALQVLGGFYLLYLSVIKYRKVRQDGELSLPLEQSPSPAKVRIDSRKLLIQGVAANVLNPKSLLFWLAIFSGLSLTDADQYTTIVLMVMTISLFYHTGLAIFAAEMGRKIGSTKWVRMINGVAALAFLAFGLSILGGVLVGVN